MEFTFDWAGQLVRCNLTDGIAISIDMDFYGPQPNHFGTEIASRRRLRLGGFTGDTRVGGSCNVDVIELIPHCNGTHTESVAHIVDDDVYVGITVPTGLQKAIVLTVEPVASADCQETYRPELIARDRVITAAHLEEQWKDLGTDGADAIVIRTLPNDDSKKRRSYSAQNEPAFFTVEAIEFINQLNCTHLLVDLPSVDRMYDDGKLTNHHLFWNVPEDTHKLVDESRRDKTITEMIYVPDTIEDGRYLLSMQVPPFYSDAAPARPILFKVEEA